MTFRSRLVLLSVLPLLASCAAGPDYVRPTVATPTAYKEAGDWKPAQPADHLERGKWWQVFGDPVLDALEDQVDISNQNIKAAEAQYRQAQAAVQGNRAGYYPTVTGTVDATRSHSASGSHTTSSGGTYTDYGLSLNASWEADVWGKVRRQVEAGEASAQASAADLAAARLSARASLAQNYFQLRIADAQKRLLDDTVDAYRRSLAIVRNQYKAGVATPADVAQAETQLKSAEAQAIDVGVQRAQLEHAIALLVGKAPADFAIKPVSLAAKLPEIPTGLPSALLERRPDIAGAERRMAAANAQIGVAQAAYYPSLTLSGSGGYQSSSLAHWFDLPNRFWSLGPALAETLFDGGLRRSQTAQARAAYDATVAEYRQTVLGAFQEVEDNLASLRILAQEAKVQAQAVQSARRSVTLTMNQYKAGTVSYLNVATTQATALSNERSAVALLGNRLTASVQLIKALGGGWDASQLADAGR